MKNIGVAFLGSGWAQKVQAPTFAMIEGVKLIGASSPNNSKKFAEQFQMPVATADWKELVSRQDVDLVCVTSPPLLHHEQTMFALEHGKHVLCEKPFAMNTRQAEEMAALAQKKKVMAIIDHELRFSPGVRYIREQVRSGALGKIYYTYNNFLSSGRRDPQLPFTWWSDKNWGGGTWGAIGSHLVDMVQYLVDDITDSRTLLDISVTKRKNNSGILTPVTSDETASSILKLQNGSTAHLFCSVVAIENRFDVQVVGEKGSLRVDINDQVFFEGMEKKGPVEIFLTEKEKMNVEKYKNSKVKVNTPFSRAFIHLADEIVTALQQNKITIADAAGFDDGVKVQKVLDKVEDLVMKK